MLLCIPLCTLCTVLFATKSYLTVGVLRNFRESLLVRLNHCPNRCTKKRRSVTVSVCLKGSFVALQFSHNHEKNNCLALGVTLQKWGCMHKLTVALKIYMCGHLKEENDYIFSACCCAASRSSLSECVGPSVYLQLAWGCSYKRMPLNAISRTLLCH